MLTALDDAAYRELGLNAVTPLTPVRHPVGNPIVASIELLTHDKIGNEEVRFATSFLIVIGQQPVPAGTAPCAVFFRRGMKAGAAVRAHALTLMAYALMVAPFAFEKGRIFADPIWWKATINDALGLGDELERFGWISVGADGFLRIAPAGC